MSNKIVMTLPGEITHDQVYSYFQKLKAASNQLTQIKNLDKDFWEMHKTLFQSLTDSADEETLKEVVNGSLEVTLPEVKPRGIAAQITGTNAQK